MNKKFIILLVMVSLVSGTIFVGCTNSEGNGEEAILLVSFGTSYADTRAVTIDAIEAKYKEVYPDYEVVKAFTSQTIIDILSERDNIEIYNVEEALDYLKGEKYSDIIVQSLHVMNGEERDEMMEIVESHVDDFDSIKLGNPLLTSTEDFENAVSALGTDIGSLAADEAVVYMGHGTHHYSNSVYAALEYHFHDQGFDNVFVGTVEGYPTIDDVIERLNESGITKVTLRPAMFVAGDHANNDMAGDEEDSWKTILKQEGFEVETYIHGLGENPAIQAMYVSHTEEAFNN